jgi:hypothetical protein
MDQLVIKRVRIRAPVNYYQTGGSWSTAADALPDRFIAGEHRVGHRTVRPVGASPMSMPYSGEGF